MQAGGDVIAMTVLPASPSATDHVDQGVVRIKEPRHDDAGLGPMVTFLRSGLAERWNSRFASLLELAEACEVAVRWSCRSGVCHNCESGLVAGELAYAPEPLDPPAEGNALICCSTPRSAVELDL